MKPKAVMTQALFQEIIEALHTGQTLSKWLLDRENKPEIPSRATIINYINSDSTNKDRYARAREDCADALAEQVLTESDNTMNDPARASNRMKARQWLASKIKPKVYGDKIDIDVKGSIDIGAAIMAGRQRARLEPPTIDNEPLLINPFD